MEPAKITELKILTQQYFTIANSHIVGSPEFLKKASGIRQINEEAEIPGFENKNIKFGKFENREFVVMMTDIRKSTNIINSPNGLVNMFLIFYVYAGIVAKIVDSFVGTSTEFLGDGVLNLFDTKDDGLDKALMNSASASWEILATRELILNPFFRNNNLPTIDLGIGIDFGQTIVTKFGYKNDMDLKAFGKCVYNASKFCKGFNEIKTSVEASQVWPTSETGRLGFINPIEIEGKLSYTLHIS